MSDPTPEGGDATVPGGVVTRRNVLRSAAAAAAVVLAAASLYLLLAPLPVEPAAWSPAAAPELCGPYEENDRLAGAERLAEGAVAGPEDVAVGPDGRVYVGGEDGRILRWRPGAGRPEVFATTGGRPLGLAFDGDGRLVVADARRGLLRVEGPGSVRTLVGPSRVPHGWANGVDVAPDGTIYFTNPSAAVPSDARRLSLMAGRPDGRLLAHDPGTGATWTVLDSLDHPNGVAVDSAGASVLVAETGRYRVRRHRLSGPGAGRTETLIANLPGFPDGVALGAGGDVWIALVAPRSRVLDAVRPYPFLTAVLMRAARAWPARAPGRGLVVRTDGRGRVRESLHDPDGDHYGWISNVVPHGPHLYLGSLEEEAVARLSRPEAGAGRQAGSRGAPRRYAPASAGR